LTRQREELDRFFFLQTNKGRKEGRKEGKREREKDLEAPLQWKREKGK